MEVFWILSDLIGGNEVGSYVGNVCFCLEGGFRGGNKDLGVNSLEVVVDFVIVNKFFEGK